MNNTSSSFVDAWIFARFNISIRQLFTDVFFVVLVTFHWHSPELVITLYHWFCRRFSHLVDLTYFDKLTDWLELLGVFCVIHSVRCISRHGLRYNIHYGSSIAKEVHGRRHVWYRFSPHSV